MQMSSSQKDGSYLVSRDRVLSLMLMTFGSLSILVTSFMLKKILSPEEFGVYAVIFTAATFVSSIGFIGGDQVFFRYAKLSDGVISINKTAAAYIFFLAVLCFLATFLYSAIYTKNIALTFLIILASFLGHVYYTLIRTQHRKIASQFSSNSWKIVFLLFSVIYISIASDKSLNLYAFLCLLLASLGLCFLLSLKLLKAKITFDESSTHENSAFSAFALSSVILAVMSFMDRVLVSEIYGVEAIGEFFYYSTFLVMPFRFLSGFIAADRSISYKKNTDANLFIKDLKLGTILAVSAGSIMAMLVFIFAGKVSLGIEFNGLLIALISSGIIRVVYSFFSAKVSVSAQPKKLKLENVYYLILCCVVVSLALLVMPFSNLVEIAWLINSLWVVRIIQYSIRVVKWR